MNTNHWLDFRNSLLVLHKLLLEFEKRSYEGKFGKIPSPHVFLGLVMENLQFAWLRQVSELIVGIDELLESKTPVPAEKFTDLLSYCKDLLTPKENGNAFQKNYYKAIHSDPEVALQHAKIQNLLVKTIGLD